MNSSDVLLYIAVLPDARTAGEVTEFKLLLAERFGARHALRSPPHITLFPPFRWVESRLGEFALGLAAFSAARQGFELTLRDFNRFGSRVLYVDVAPSLALEALERQLVDFLERVFGLSSSQPHGFHPHMTIAHKDLSQDVFSQAWGYFSGRAYERSFPVGSLACLRHNAKGWEVWQSFPLGSGSGLT
jgi:2'-5' RNA ligase